MQQNKFLIILPLLMGSLGLQAQEKKPGLQVSGTMG